MGTHADLPLETPGVSAEREYQRRRNARRTRIRERYGLLGSAVASLAGEPMHVHAWHQGAVGEIATANSLRIHLHRTDVIVLHDRRIPCRGRWNIDHIAIGPGGVTVIDTKASRGRVELGHVGIIHKDSRHCSSTAATAPANSTRSSDRSTASGAHSTAPAGRSPSSAPSVTRSCNARGSITTARATD